MVPLEKPEFNAAALLTHAGLGRKVVQLAPREVFFSQGDPADSVFYLQDGRAKITVVSHAGKEATIALLSAGDFVGEESLAAVHGLRLATTEAITACTALKISREEMIRVMHEEHEFSDLFLKFLLARSMRTQADLVDQTLQLQRKAFGTHSPVDGGIREIKRTRDVDSQDLAGDAGGNDRNDTVSSELLYEPVPQTRLYRVRRSHPGSPIPAECGFAR